MASRLARNIIAGRRLPSLICRTPPPHLLPTSYHISKRHASNVPAEDPANKARSILDSLPGNSMLSKTAILSSGAGLSIYAISNELFVFNEESIVMIAAFAVLWGLFKYGAPIYNEWASVQIAKVSGILNSARAGHREAVQSRIDNVKQLGSVVDVTKQLFEVSKETARLEAQAFELQQQTTLVQEAKQVLDSWVRYEGQIKQRQQKELAENVIGKVMKELENPRVLQQILQQSITDVEKIVSSKVQ